MDLNTFAKIKLMDKELNRRGVRLMETDKGFQLVHKEQTISPLFTGHSEYLKWLTTESSNVLYNLTKTKPRK